MAVLAIGDIGVVSDMMHIGDEAMFEAARDELAARGVDVVGVSSAPEESAARYGVRTVSRMGFVGLDRDAAERRAARLVAAARGEADLAGDDPARGVLGELDAASGLLNAGGGNLASRWPVHIYERSTLAAMARARGLPVVVSGQTFGPDLEPADAARVAELVRTAALTSTRESDSAALVRGWGAEAVVTVDDASFLGWPRRSTDAAGPVLVSLSGWFAHRPADEVEQRIAAVLDRAVRDVGPVVFHAHFGPLGSASEPSGDTALHERIRARMSEPSRVEPTGDSLGAASLARSARLLVTGRYHPAVFAAPAGVPIVALAADDYTRIKLGGALGHWGQDTVLDLDDLADAGAAAGALARAAGSRETVSARAAERFDAHRATASRWWDAVARTFSR
ncbi:polysaccharide pyruvyl transferase family protein [Microbacterium sp. ARD31]|uniref:polysaccharide pyruvyl transferase family protein n=1 Tax=Microbacterium sp. ARD31 TaxID=2962576 RepID=UPI002881A3A9|nr:polysaccharide pyruvyl transferase family protein [Microbacterium sp. ARD31]MDT0180354.1 polysaccharide pyruvyl transferase family protein [Microbacterium sp. ARD31]